MLDVTLTDRGDTLAAATPYDGAFVSAAKALGGKYVGGEWVFDARNADRVADLCLDVYGTDGSDDSATLVTVRITVPAGVAEQAYRLAGRRLVYRPGRDAEVRYTSGVISVEGRFPSSGGSVKNPRLDNPQPVVLEIRDVTPGTAQLMREQAPRYRGGSAEIVVSDDNRSALAEERERLVARIAEIDVLLATTTV